MTEKKKDIDYLFISARVKALENQLLNRERMEQILEAKTDAEVVKIIQECGYPELPIRDPEAMDAALAEARQSAMEDLAASAPEPGFLDIFRLKYDYHNLKSMLKAGAMGVSPDDMLMDMGRIPTGELRSALESGERSGLPFPLASALAEAKEVLDTTRDPQLSDITVDRWMYRDMTDTAKSTGSDFLQGYVTLVIDAANLRVLVRTLRMGKSPEFLKGVLFEDGSIHENWILSVAGSNGNGLAELYAATELREAAESGADALSGGMLTEFEKRCDDAVGNYLSGAQLVAFGEAPLIGYLAEKETEYLNLRIILMGRRAGLSPETIRSRLRDSYV